MRCQRGGEVSGVRSDRVRTKQRRSRGGRSFEIRGRQNGPLVCSRESPRGFASIRIMTADGAGEGCVFWIAGMRFLHRWSVSGRRANLLRCLLLNSNGLLILALIVSQSGWNWNSCGIF